MRLDQPEACMAAGTLEHLPSTMGAERSTGVLTDELDQDLRG